MQARLAFTFAAKGAVTNLAAMLSCVCSMADKGLEQGGDARMSMVSDGCSIEQDDARAQCLKQAPLLSFTSDDSGLLQEVHQTTYWASTL